MNYAETIFYYIYTILHLAGEENKKTSDRNKSISKRRTPLKMYQSEILPIPFPPAMHDT